MAGEAPRQVNQCVDAVYVLTVATFAERIAHIRRELGRHAIAFEFVLAHDVGALEASSVGARFAGSALAPAQRSLALKHAQAWKNAVERGQRRILVFEDDAVLASDFVSRFDDAMRAADRLPPGWLVFLGGADTKVPDSYFLAQGPLIPLQIATAEGYVTDLEAARKRLAWLGENEIALPADHLIKQADAELGIAHFWLRPPIVEQGSVLGLFESELDAHRRKHSRAFNVLRNRWNKFQRHRLRGWLVRARIMLKSK